MTRLRIPWSPRLLLAGRAFRLPVQAENGPLELRAQGLDQVGRRWSDRDRAFFYYFRAPEKSGDCAIEVRQGGQTASATLQVRTLEQLRRPFIHQGAFWPRRWPLGKEWSSTKTRQTLQEMPVSTPDPQAVRWWLSLDDQRLWRQLPVAEQPRAHFVNVHQGCPSCGTAIFAHGGFYPWKRSHCPVDFRSACPQCGAVFPSNDLLRGDYTSGEFVDDGYGYFDPEGHLFLFTATYARDQVRAFGAGIGQLTDHLRNCFDPAAARTLGLMLLRYGVEILYLGAVPQFRFGPSRGEEQPWEWGQPDWRADELARLGMLRYCIDVPYISETLALAYDTLWPFLRQDQELVERAQGLGLKVQQSTDIIALVEEMLACKLQCALDGGAASNLPRVSMGALVLLRGLDRPDAAEVLDWLYDQGPDRLRVFGVNNFFPDGTPPEATGGYNSIHTDGLFALEHHLRQLRSLHPAAYPESRFPSLMADPRAARVARAACEIAMVGKSWFQFGDGSAPGSSAQLGKDLDEPKLLRREVFHAPLSAQTLEWAAQFTGDPVVASLRDAVRQDQHRPLGSTIHDGVGIAILRTGEAPERAALGVCYGDATGHRHMDLLDVQLLAFGYPFLTDLGYPQSWASIGAWEAQWATHNSLWGVVPGLDPGRLAGRGRLLHYLSLPGVQVLDLEAQRWAWDAEQSRWYRPGVSFRRLLALVETDGEGVAVVDLARLRGGTQHWRVCRGCGPQFHSEEVEHKRRAGTVAGEHLERGDLSRLAHPDHAALAFMDEVALVQDRPFWKGTWPLDLGADVHLDLHQVRVSPGTQVLTARATAAMGKPEESTYAFRPVLWQREVASPQHTTCVDLVFEPRRGESTLAAVCGLSADAPTACGVELRTRQGRSAKIYWSPEAGPQELTAFADGVWMQGALAVVTNERIAACGATAFYLKGREYPFAHAVQRGVLKALDRSACTIEVEGLERVAAGDRIRINPEGRGHNYLVERTEELSPGRHCLSLDVTTLLGRGRVLSVEEKKVELEFHVMARTGNLHGTRLQRQSGEWAEIAEAFNPDAGHTVIHLAQPLTGVEQGEWLEVVDGAPGDQVLLERVIVAGRQA